MPGANGASSATTAAASAWPSTRFDIVAGKPAGPQQSRLADARHDGGFDADGAGAAVDHQVDAAAQVGQHMGGVGRRHMAGTVGRGRHHRPAEGLEQGRRYPVRRNPHRDAVEPGQRQIGHAAVRPFRQHQGQRARPERRRQPHGGVVENGEALGCRQVRDMGDQRIEGRTALGGVKPGDGLAIAGIGAEPIDGLGRERDQPASLEAGGGGLDRGLSAFTTRVAGSALICLSSVSQACSFKRAGVIRPPTVGV